MLEGEGKDGNETCRRLILAAADVFARHGFGGARVRQIADAAQVNLAAVNYYYGGKEGLYRATLRHLAKQADGNGSHAGSESPEAMTQRRIRELLERFNGGMPPALARILAHEAMAPTGNLESLLESATRPEHEPLRELLREIGRLRTPVTEK